LTAGELPWSGLPSAEEGIVTEHRSQSVNPYEARTFAPGEDLDLVQIGENWWTGFDIGAAHIVPATKVVVVTRLASDS
jgi:hypothetical protein